MQVASTAGIVNASKIYDTSAPIYRLVQIRRLKGDLIEISEDQTERVGRDIPPYMFVWCEVESQVRPLQL